MFQSRFSWVLSIAMLIVCPLPSQLAPTIAAADDKKESKEESDQPKSPKPAKPELSVTQHSATIGGQEIAFTATAGKLLMKNDAGDAKANVFFVAYTKNNAESSKRPVTFCFNGGPGSCSVWLHLGMLGPQRVKMSDDAKPLRPPHELIDNPYSMLDQTDLVFIDPVSTGFSRPAKGEKKQQFHGYDEDVRSVGQFIHDYTTQYGRWGSPKFLLGESYGGLRAAGLSGELQNRYKMYLNGIVLVSAVVDFQTLHAGDGNDLAYALFVPSYAATAWYHKALPADMQKLDVAEVVAQAEAFATGPYVHALLAGDSLPQDQRMKTINRMAELTGLSVEYLDQANLRVSMRRFGKELLRSKKLVVGRFDSRYSGVDSDHVDGSVGHDPSASVFFGPFTSAMNQYLRDVLEVKEDRVYEILTSKVHPWDYSEFTNRYVNASKTLRKSMRDNPFLKVFAACGYYDLATPAFAMQYTRDHLNLPTNVRDNFTMEFYEGGHMMYVHEPSLKKLRTDLIRFYQSALQAEAKASE
jgi:carboxypeptidase C (cathepsin A)